MLRGGILLRSARRVSDGKVISGPSLLVDEILRLSRASEILELVTVNWNGNISAFPPDPSSTLPNNPHDNPSTMYLVRAPASITPSASTAASLSIPTTDKDALVRGKRRIFLSPRIGLDISHPAVAACTPSPLAHPRTLYIAQPYRFYVCPHLLTANGRGQTFVGVYDAVVEKGHCEDDSELLGEVARLSGVKGVTAMKYLAEFRKGLDPGASEGNGNAGAGDGDSGDVEASKELKEWIGPKGKTVTSSVMVWLKMIGTLRRVRAASKSAAGGLDRVGGPSSAHPSASPLVNARPWT